MERKAAKELLHIRGWLDRVDEVVGRGKDAYLAGQAWYSTKRSAGPSLLVARPSSAQSRWSSLPSARGPRTSPTSELPDRCRDQAGLSADQLRRLQHPEAENLEPRRANAILGTAAFFAVLDRTSPPHVKFIEERRHDLADGSGFGVEPICRVPTERGCKVAAPTY